MAERQVRGVTGDRTGHAAEPAHDELANNSLRAASQGRPDGRASPTTCDAADGRIAHGSPVDLILMMLCDKDSLGEQAAAAALGQADNHALADHLGDGEFHCRAFGPGLGAFLRDLGDELLRGLADTYVDGGLVGHRPRQPCGARQQPDALHSDHGQQHGDDDDLGVLGGCGHHPQLIGQAGEKPLLGAGTIRGLGDVLDDSDRRGPRDGQSHNRQQRLEAAGEFTDLDRRGIHGLREYAQPILVTLRKMPCHKVDRPRWQEGQCQGHVLDATAFEAGFNMPLVHETVRAELNARRQGTASTKTRGQVSGGEAKPWRRRAPVALAPGPRGVPDLDRRRHVCRPAAPSLHREGQPQGPQGGAALRLSVHADRESLAIFDAGTFDGPWSKQAAQLLGDWGADTPTLVLLSETEAEAGLSFRNLVSADVMPAADAGVADVVRAASLLISEAALSQLVARATGAAEEEEA